MNESPENEDRIAKAKAKLKNRIKAMEVEILKLTSRAKKLEEQLDRVIDHYKEFQLRSLNRHSSAEKWNVIALSLIFLFAVVYGGFLLYLQVKRRA